jgi:hypothetical protein
MRPKISIPTWISAPPLADFCATPDAKDLNEHIARFLRSTS